MRHNHAGFTLVELLIALIIVGIIAAMATVNYVAAQKRAREASLKTNMHTFQLAAEDFGLRSPSYAATADSVAALLPQGGGSMRNPYTKTPGRDNAWADQPSWQEPLQSASTQPGVVTYGDSVGLVYQIVGRGSAGDLPLRLKGGS